MLINGEQASSKRFMILLIFHIVVEEDLSALIIKNELSLDKGIKLALFKNYLLAIGVFLKLTYMPLIDHHQAGYQALHQLRQLQKVMQ